jgi:hypothetical protein
MPAVPTRGAPEPMSDLANNVPDDCPASKPSKNRGPIVFKAASGSFLSQRLRIKDA